ncbi:sigma factor G inhibitor Gin [Bacillus sp. 1P06AnD]|uniref:sigma factor G inhibitor Gin n=1 Tax=Bacillus sp. 1P06AnD TaxID=3132208 RepID=UPI0039A0D093
MKRKGKSLQHCIICEEEKKQGFFLYTSFICDECENGILAAETSDPMYKYYLEKLKSVTHTQSFT